jgi:hypothetical protein
LPTRLAAVLAATAHPGIGHVTTTPAARLWSDATGHGRDFSRGDAAIPVSWTVGSQQPCDEALRGTMPTAMALLERYC